MCCFFLGGDPSCGGVPFPADPLVVGEGVVCFGKFIWGFQFRVSLITNHDWAAGALCFQFGSACRSCIVQNKCTRLECCFKYG